MSFSARRRPGRLRAACQGSTCLLYTSELDSAISDVMDYFEIFMQRMVLCKKAANFLKLRFHLEINGVLLVS